MLRDLTLADALQVVADMRAEDAACVRAVCGHEPGEWFAAERWQSSGPAWALYQRDEPIAIGGLNLPNAWTGVLWMVARPGMSASSWRKALRATRTVLSNALSMDNTMRRHRVEAHVLHGWIGASAFAERIGLRCEGIRRAAGAHGESIEVWAATAQPKE